MLVISSSWHLQGVDLHKYVLKWEINSQKCSTYAFIKVCRPNVCFLHMWLRIWQPASLKQPLLSQLATFYFSPQGIRSLVFSFVSAVRYSRQGDTVSTMINTPFHLTHPCGGDARVNKWSVLRWRTIDKRLTGGRHDVIGAWGNEWSILLLGGSARRGSDWGAGTEGVNWTRGVWNGAVCGQGNFVLLTQQEHGKNTCLIGSYF